MAPRGQASHGRRSMTEKSRRKIFSEEIEALRKHQGRLEPIEIARLAHLAGLLPHEALEEVRDHFEYRYSRSTNLTEALALFVSSLCDNESSDFILEYTSMPFLLTARIAETHAARRLAFVTEDKQLADTLRVLFLGRGLSIFDSIENLSPETTFGSLVCMPSIGLRRPDDKRADGYGGEIIQDLSRHLSKKGTFYWVTGRGVVFNSRATRTLAYLEALGLHVAGCIETPPGAFPGTMVEGAVIVLSHEAPTKRFVAALRDLETAKATATAFLTGPTRKSGPNWVWLAPQDSPSFSVLEQSGLIKKLTPRGR